MFAPGDGREDNLEIPAFLRRARGEAQPAWSPTPASAAPARELPTVTRRDDYYAALVRAVGEDAAAAWSRDEAEREAIRERARNAKRKAQPRKEYLVGMRWDVESAQYVPDINATPSAKAIAMEKFSKPFTAATNSSARSNARRAARKAGVDPSKVVACPDGGFYFPLPDPSASAGVPAKPQPAPEVKRRQIAAMGGAAKAKRAKVAKRSKKAAKAKNAKAKKPGKARAANGEGSKQIAELARLMHRKGGLRIDEAVRLTGWKPHTTRARISVNVKAMLERGEIIERRRIDKISTYFIVPKRQGTLPGVE